MTKKKKIIGLILASVLVLLGVFLFSKAHRSKKIFSPDKQYSVYAQTYMYSELLCVFSFMDCWHYGNIYLYDEKEKKVLESAYTDVTEAYETVNWFTGMNKVSFKSNAIKIDDDFWNVPRPFKTE